MQVTRRREHLRYVLYARKSSEDKDRQVQSIDDQLKWARGLGLNIVKVWEEERSAKRPGNRPRFDEMVQFIEQGYADGIISWQVNRLSRNPVESAKLQWLLQEIVIQSIVTHEREYLPSDNAILFSIESGMANQYILELRANSRRGVLSKVSKGWFPGMAPHGYLNDKSAERGDRTILDDPERWTYVRRMWDLMLTGNYNPRQIRRIVTAEGFRTRPTKRKPSGVITTAAMYKLFTNIFYTGMFEFMGEAHQGKHKRMVTLSEYQRVQQLLGAKGRPRPQSREFSYTGLIRCGECGCLVTAETKIKYLKSTGSTRAYTYYRCTKQKQVPCSQRTIRLEDLEAQIAHILASLTILPEFRDWALKVLARESKVELNYRADKHRQLARVVEDYEQELYDLNKTYTRGNLDDDFYLAEKQSLRAKILTAKQELEDSRTDADKWLTLSENVFLFANHAAETFAHGDIRTRRELFSALGGRFTLTNGVVTYEQARWFQRLSEESSQLQRQIEGVRTSKIGNLHLEIAEIAAILRNWLRLVQEIRTLVTEAASESGYLHIPRLEDPHKDNPLHFLYGSTEEAPCSAE